MEKPVKKEARLPGQKPQSRERVDYVMTLLRQGWLGSQVVTHLRQGEGEATWGKDLTLRECYRYIAAARRGFAKISDANRAVERGKAMQRFEGLYANALEIQDYRVALAAEKERVALLGLADDKAATPPLLPPGYEVVVVKKEGGASE